MLTSSQSPLLPTGFRIEYLPHPRDMVQIKEGTPYTVPAGKLFVLTGLGSTGIGNGHTNMQVDGVPECVGSGVDASGSLSTMAPGCTVAAGKTIVLTGGNPPDPADGRAWGYLASE